MYNISVLELKKLVNKVNIIDIRDKSFYMKGHIDGSINITYDELINKYNEYLNKFETYYIYCDYGKKSYYLVMKLNRIGFHVINILGGYKEWIKYN